MMLFKLISNDMMANVPCRPTIAMEKFMIPKKSLLACALALGALSALPAQAQLVIEPVINTAPQPVYAPAPAYYGAPVVTTWDERHRRHDFEYWRARHNEEGYRRR